MPVEKNSVRHANFDSPLWRLKTVLAFIPVSQSTWLSGVSRGDMPKPVKIPGTSAVAWRSEDIKNWVKKLTPEFEPSEYYLNIENEENQLRQINRKCARELVFDKNSKV